MFLYQTQFIQCMIIYHTDITIWSGNIINSNCELQIIVYSVMHVFSLSTLYVHVYSLFVNHVPGMLLFIMSSTETISWSLTYYDFKENNTY
jgi:hypothetical protein